LAGVVGVLIATTGDVALEAAAAAVGGAAFAVVGGRLPTVVLVTPVGGVESVAAPAPANPPGEGPVTVESPDPQPSAAMMATTKVLERTTFIFNLLVLMLLQEHTPHAPEPRDARLFASSRTAVHRARCCKADVNECNLRTTNYFAWCASCARTVQQLGSRSS
jgi:hypothetical protein